MHLLEVHNPVAQQRGLLNVLKTNPRPKSLDNLTIGLVWSGTHGGDLALNRAGEIIKERFSGVKTNFYAGVQESVVALITAKATALTNRPKREM